MAERSNWIGMHVEWSTRHRPHVFWFALRSFEKDPIPFLIGPNGAIVRGGRGAQTGVIQRTRCTSCVPLYLSVQLVRRARCLAAPYTDERTLYYLQRHRTPL